MSLVPRACPPVETLERIALGQSADASIVDHVGACSVCSAALTRIRDDNRFLSGFAIDGALPTLPTFDAPGITEIPGYQIVREIHRGGQGVVYQAIQRSTRRDVAIKVMRQGPFATLADRSRFEREIDTLGSLNHPNIVTVHDAGIVAGQSYLVMNYVDGEPLDRWIWESRAGMRDTGQCAAPYGEPPKASDAPAPKRDLTVSIEIFIKVCDAIHAAHLRGVIHRDIKPSNIRVDRNDEPHVLDFGLAKSVGAAADSAMTRTGQFVGSLPWASPEQLEGDSSKIDLRTDVYSLGVVLFQLLTGELPFDVGSNLRDALDSILTRDPPAPSAVRSPVCDFVLDDELDTIALKCLSKDRDRRYQTAGELARDLRRYLAGEAIEAKRDSALYVLRKTLRRYRFRVAASGAFVVLLAAFGITMSILYRHSALLEQQAVHSAASLSELLSERNIENGRMAGLLENLEQAETLLWRELLTHREGGNGAGFQLNEPPGPPEAHWALWDLYRRRPCLRTLTPQPAATRAAVLGDDQKSLWTVDARGVVQRIDEFGQSLDSYRLPPGAGGALGVDSTGRTVLAFGKGVYTVWRRGVEGPPILTLRPQGSAEADLFMISRSGRCVSTLVDGVATVWNSDPPAERGHFSSDESKLTTVAISNDDRLLAGRDQFGGLHVWEIDSKRQIITQPGKTMRPETVHDLGDLLFSPDDRLLADAWLEISGRVWNLEANPPTAVELGERQGNYRAQGFSPDGRLLAVGDLGGALRIFDTRSGEKIAHFVAHPSRIRSVFFSGDGRGIWTCGEDNVRLWEFAPDAGVRAFHVENEYLHAVELHQDRNLVLAGGGAGKLFRIDTVTSTVDDQSIALQSTISSLAISPDARRIAIATYANAAYLCDADEPGRDPVRLRHPSRVSHICFSPDGASLATACDDSIVRIWRVSDAALQCELRGCADRVPQIAFDPRLPRLAAAVRDGSLLVWNLDSNECRTWIAPSNVPLRTVRFSHDGRHLITAGAGRAIQVWDADRTQRVAELVGHNQEIYCVDISHDDELIASGDSGGTIRLWHLPLCRPLATLDGQSGAIMALRFSSRRRALVSAGLDGTVREWDLNHYERHIAGQVQTQLSRLGPAISSSTDFAKWLEWADARMREPAPTGTLSPSAK